MIVLWIGFSEIPKNFFVAWQIILEAVLLPFY
jgi:hypothetical protein